MVGEFFGSFLLFTLIALVAALPVVLLARRRRPDKARRFLIGAVATGLVCGLLAGASKRYVDQCLEAGNPNCIDWGGTGLQVLIVAGFAIVALISAYLLSQD